ncbi:MAG: polyprenyl synthetase family protein [Planctomycetota bacterium]
MLQQVLEMFPPPVRLAFAEVDRWLDQYTQAADGFPERLREAMRYSLLAPGKRLRPLLVLAACDACGGEPARALPAACAVEMIHTYSLIHDDLPAMDDDELRRGRPTCHIQFDEATAILAGDALIPLAFEVIATGLEPAELARRAVRELARAAGATQLVGGQADDLQHQFADPNREMLQAIHLRKTAAMMAVSLKLGGLVAGAGPSVLDRLENFGEKLGLAFQIADDLLDLQGEQAKIGKKTGKDESRGKLTYPGLLGVEQSVFLAGELVAAAQSELAALGDRAAGLRQLASFFVDRTH